MNKKQNKQQEKKINDINAENIDNANHTYNNCVFYQIESANVVNNKPIPVNVSEEDIKQVQLKIIQFVSESTGYPQEMVERILEQAERFMRDNY